MIIDVELKRGKAKKGEIGAITSEKSEYKPTELERARILEVLRDFTLGSTIMNKPYRQLNDMTVKDRQNEDQKLFNNYVEPKPNDPDERWKSQAIRPIVRNRTISIAAHVTGSLIFPQIFAQNDQDDMDKDAATVMRDLIEWTADQSEYAKTLFYGIVAALVNPGAIIHTEYRKVMRTVKELDAKGKWEKKEILDEEMSGFQDTIVPLDELFIGDINEHNIQRQPFLIWRKAIDYSQALSKYGDNDNFKKYVKPSIQCVFDSATGQFYEEYDTNLEERLVEEVIYWNRTADLRLVLVNGVLITDVDEPNPRKDKKYPFLKFGYEPVDEGKFFYYFSLVRKMSKDAEIVNKLYRMMIDGSYLQAMPPTGIFGEEQFDSSIIVPGRQTQMKDVNAKIVPITSGANPSAALGALQKVEASISESSNDQLQSGQAEAGAQTAFEISRLEQNARIMLGMFAKMIGFGVKEYGELRIGDIIQFLTVGEVEQITNGQNMKYKKFLIPERMSGGQQKSRKIVMGQMEPKDKLADSQAVLEEEGGIDSKLEIFKVRPDIFRSLKFLVKVSPDVVTPPSDNLKKAMMLEQYDRAIANPILDQEMITKELLLGAYDTTKNDPDKFIKKQDPMMAMMGQMPGNPQGSPLAKILGNGQQGKLNQAV